MCCCESPTINGQSGYRWQPTDNPMTIPVNPPELLENETLLYDEPGRCGGLDGHSHHYRVVSNIGLHLLVRHGGGDERFRLSTTPTFKQMLATLDSNQRYWLFSAIYFAHSYGERKGREEATHLWRKAAAEKRIKTRKQRGTDGVKVWIETIA